MKQYRIIASCNPYNARTHYHGGEVLKYDGPTPVEWVWIDEIFNTNEEARAVFEGWAAEDGFYWDEEAISDFCRDEGITPEEFKKNNPWYQGPGNYDQANNELLYASGEDSYHEDTMSYRIEEF